MLEKTRDSYNVDAISQALGEAAIGDQDYARDTWRQVREARAALRDGLRQIGLAAGDSHSNFLLTRVPEGARRSALALYQALKARGILVRHFDVPRLRDHLRISVGTPEQNQRLIAALAEELHD
jgi:histidinol-phosphate aminotransferase